MKTAESIERQESKKEDEKRAKTTCSSPQNGSPVSEEARRKRIDQIKPFQFQPGISGNLRGHPRVDLAAELARAVFDKTSGDKGRIFNPDQARFPQPEPQILPRLMTIAKSSSAEQYHEYHYSH
jgi:hypothetical protein